MATKITRKVALEGRLEETVPLNEDSNPLVRIVLTDTPWNATSHHYTGAFKVETSLGVIEGRVLRSLEIDMGMGWAYAEGRATLRPTRAKGEPWKRPVGVEWELQLNRDDPVNGAWECRLVCYFDGDDYTTLVMRNGDANQTFFSVSDSTAPAPA